MSPSARPSRPLGLAAPGVEPRPENGHGLEDFQSADDPMRACLELARVAARTDLPVLVLGETGTGKTILARALHNSSRRARAPFVAFNAAALSDTLLDSQLFGHEKGAFTGADHRLRGHFEVADGGTLFIDEIADMSLAAQAKILRAVEYGEFERLGGETLLTANVRLISATHLPIHRFLKADQFRRDLFYRISGITLRLPSLRHRPNDLPALIAAEVTHANKLEGKTITGLSRGALDRLCGYPWPGNLRELKRVVHTAVALTDGDVIAEEAVLLQSGPEMEDIELTPEVRRINSADGGDSNDSAASSDLSLRSAERSHIRRVLEQFHGNKRRAAKALGLSRSTLDRKLSSRG